MKNVVLIGFMGTGKSSCGRAAAQQLGYRFVDLDKEIEDRYGMAIPEDYQTDVLIGLMAQMGGG